MEFLAPSADISVFGIIPYQNIVEPFKCAIYEPPSESLWNLYFCQSPTKPYTMGQINIIGKREITHILFFRSCTLVHWLRGWRRDRVEASASWPGGRLTSARGLADWVDWAEEDIFESKPWCDNTQYSE